MKKTASPHPLRASRPIEATATRARQEPGVPPEEHLRLINDAVQRTSTWVGDLKNELATAIVGQERLIERLLVGLLANGHLLLEGAPGLAKTLALKSLARALHVSFQRIQFTPDMLPADIIGTEIYDAREATFEVKRGPVFANLVLADEINRAPAKVQAALLEAMQERQVTIGEESLALPSPFLVMATQNPIEQEGTYPLPEAQMDRFLLKVVVDFPSIEEELKILDLAGSADPSDRIRPVVTPEQLAQARHACEGIHVDERIKAYIVDLVHATRNPTRFGIDLEGVIRNPASPRASLSLLRGARAMAFLRDRGFVTPADVKAIAMDAMRHRIGLTWEAEADGHSPESVVDTVCQTVPVP